MLVITRKLGESVVIGDNIVVKVVKIRGNAIGLAIEAPSQIKIMRSELLAKNLAKGTSPALPAKENPHEPISIAG